MSSGSSTCEAEVQRAEAVRSRGKFHNRGKPQMQPRGGCAYQPISDLRRSLRAKGDLMMSEASGAGVAVAQPAAPPCYAASVEPLLSALSLPWKLPVKAARP